MNEPKAYYTGGNIWIAEMELDNGTYAVVNSIESEWLCIYKYNEEYLPEDMEFSGRAEELNEELKKVYDKLYAELKKAVG